MSADELVRQWAKTKVRHQLPQKADYLHYRDCPDIEVYRCSGVERPLSSVTPDKWTYFSIVWGCQHGPGRLVARLHYEGTMVELIQELDDMETATVDLQMDFAREALETFTEPIFAANYAAPGGGTVWHYPPEVPAEDPPWLS